MSLSRIGLPVMSLCLFLPATALAVDVAVMPVQGVNLSEGESDAIGVLFANAFANQARAVVASPLHTKPLRAEGRTAPAIAAQLGATRYVELKAIRLDRQVQLSGVLYGQDGSVLFRAETTAWGLESMDTAVATLAQALALRQPVAVPQAYAPAPYPVGPYELPPLPPAPRDPNRTVHDHGVKLGVVQPYASGKSFSSALLIEFDARYSVRDYFVEFGAGLLVPTDDNYYTASRTIRVGGGFLEFGGSYYLWAGQTAGYLGAGLSPAILNLETGDSSSYATDSHTTATCGAHGQAGVTFMRESRVKLFAEFRLTQLLLAVAHPVVTDYHSTQSDTYRPTVIAFQGGIIW